MNWDRNLYYNPEATGFEKVLELDDPGACYSFDTLLVIRQTGSGHLYWATDSGCSCPSPFESHTLQDFKRITAESFPDFQKAVEEHCPYTSDYLQDEWQCDKTEALAKVSRLLREMS